MKAKVSEKMYRNVLKGFGLVELYQRLLFRIKQACDASSQDMWDAKMKNVGREERNSI